MVIESLFKLELDLLILRDELFLPREDLAAFKPLLFELQQISWYALLRLLVSPLSLTDIDPIGQEFLRLGVGLDQDCVFV